MAEHFVDAVKIDGKDGVTVTCSCGAEFGPNRTEAEGRAEYDKHYKKADTT